MFPDYKIAHLYAFVACHSLTRPYYTQFRPFEKNFRAHEPVETNHPASREHPQHRITSVRKSLGTIGDKKSGFKSVILRDTVSATEKFNTHYRLCLLSHYAHPRTKTKRTLLASNPTPWFQPRGDLWRVRIDPCVPKRARIVGHDFRFGCVRPNSQFLSVPNLTPSFAAKMFFAISLHKRQVISVLDKLCGRRCEFPLTAVITRWQKGFRNHPFRQIF